ncbi:hypothetical protein AJ80_08287 [Polytolypa hystricis UAMH7299]|uniref:Uncharacterized protein n=1 Tax=Polytolypa hystricis (strain UAMH7299) TaxID=1447883 RepID=A0A2B7XA26_POLH7|nr:hypothetical protein AJ80_08287 [Polytolypa hystricis UAMH7299]
MASRAQSAGGAGRYIRKQLVENHFHTMGPLRTFENTLTVRANDLAEEDAEQYGDTVSRLRGCITWCPGATMHGAQTPEAYYHDQPCHFPDQEDPWKRHPQGLQANPLRYYEDFGYA